MDGTAIKEYGLKSCVVYPVDILLYNAAWLRGFIDRKNSCRSITARIIGAAGGYRHSLSNRG